jgi:hypothetical protein
VGISYTRLDSVGELSGRMDVLVDLLPLSYRAKAEPAAKDRRQQQQQQHQQLKQATSQLSDRATETREKKLNTEVLPDIERRTGEERRQHDMHRGRWLESRSRHDRRTEASGILVKI